MTLQRNKSHERCRTAKKANLLAIAPIIKHRTRNRMPTRNICNRHAIALAFLNNPNLLVIRPATAATGIRNRQNLNAGGVFVCVHKDTR